MTLGKRVVAEFLGTFWLVFGGCGSALFAARFDTVGIGLLGVSLAFGLSVVTLAYAVGHISGGHFNPAVSIGLVVARRLELGALVPYVLAQVLGGFAAAALLYIVASSAPGFDTHAGFASNGYGELSPGHYSLVACGLTEALLTFFFLLIILGATSRSAPKGFGPLAIGLGLVLVHLVSIPITNTSVNPARSLSQAIFAGTGALSQVWLFWVAPIMGAVLAGVVHNWLMADLARDGGTRGG